MYGCGSASGQRVLGKLWGLLLGLAGLCGNFATIGFDVVMANIGCAGERAEAPFQAGGAP